MPYLESIAFDTSAFQLVRSDPTEIFWLTPDGDIVSVHFFDRPPDLPTDARSIDDLRVFMLKLLSGSSTRLVELASHAIADCRALRMIVKAPQQPSGMTYVGSISIPFLAFSYVIKAHCPEREPIGVRDTVLLDRALGAQTIALGDNGAIIGPWDPDDARHDADFPAHPISRSRRLLAEITSWCVLDGEVKTHDPFPLP